MTKARRWLATISALALTTVLGTTSAAQAAVPSYQFKNFYGLCLDARADGKYSPNNNADPVWLYTCNGYLNQKWILHFEQTIPESGGSITLFEIQSAFDSNMCLDAATDSPRNPSNDGDTLQMYRCADAHGGAAADNQEWVSDGQTWYNWDSIFYMCLDAERDGINNPTNPGDKIQLWDCNGQPQQNWTLV